jgi:uncharacterized protein YvpB
MLRRIAGREGFRAAVGAALAAAAVLGLTAPAQALDRRMRVPVYRQQLRDDCEAASLRMLLAYRGRHLGDAQLLARIGVDRRHPVFGRSGPRSGDPYRAFVGDPDGSELRGTGYGVYYPRIAAAARAEGATVLFAGEHYSPAQLYRQLAAGHPAVVWIDYLWRARPDHPYRAWDGRLVRYAGPAEHALAVVGVTTNGVYVNDPARGASWISRKQFERGWSSYADMAVVVS